MCVLWMLVCVNDAAMFKHLCVLYWEIGANEKFGARRKYYETSASAVAPPEI